MPGSTPSGFPYVLPGDNVADYPATSQGLADKLEASVPFAMAAGTAAVPLSNSTSGNVVVTLPAGRFTQTPLVQATKRSSAAAAIPLVPMITASSPSAITVALYGAASATTATVNVAWSCVQMKPGSSEG